MKYVELQINVESNVGSSTHDTSSNLSDMTTAKGPLSEESLQIGSSSEVTLKK